MDKLITKIERFINQHNISGTVLIGFSGGYDSMCLLDIVNKISEKHKITPIAIHLNHNWRGEESLIEEKNCKEFCDKNKIKFYSEILDENVPHTETAAREARYEFFEKCAQKFNSKIFFTAHNATDNAETVLYRVFKGTGVNGLEGIKSRRGIYYRPLLTTQRAEIENYCKEAQLKPNNDSSNADKKYKRNLIRHEILKAGETINLDAVWAINSLSAIATETNEIIEEYLKLLKKELFDGEKIKTHEFLKLSSPVQNRIIYEIFINNNLDYDREKINRVRNFLVKNAEKKSGITTSLSEELDFFVNNEYAYTVEKQEKSSFEIKITATGEFKTPYGILTIEDCSDTNDLAVDDEYTAYVNVSDIDFTLRTRCDGDFIQPLGMNGTQKIKKYLNEKKIPKHQKNELLLLTSGKEVVWVIGVGLSEKIKAGKKITHVLKFKQREG